MTSNSLLEKVISFVKNKIKSIFKDAENSFYALGFIFFFIQILSSSNQKPETEITLYIGLIFIFFGFFLFVSNFILIFDKKPINIIKTVIFNIAVSPFSFFIARHLVSSEIGLPPQDFDLTILTIIPLIHIYVISIILALSSLLYLFWKFLTDFLKLIFSSFLNISGLIIIAFFLSNINGLEKIDKPIILAVIVLIPLTALFLDSRRKPYAEDNTAGVDTKKIVRAFAMLVVSSTIMEAYETKIPKKSVIRLLAYYLDYYENPLYPNLKLNQKVRLHSNGVVSYAIKKGFDITIRLEEYEKN